MDSRLIGSNLMMCLVGTLIRRQQAVYTGVFCCKQHDVVSCDLTSKTPHQ